MRTVIPREEFHGELNINPVDVLPLIPYHGFIYQRSMDFLSFLLKRPSWYFKKIPVGH
jgi:hypothetical protein